jgi:hypothetical protein
LHTATNSRAVGAVQWPPDHHDVVRDVCLRTKRQTAADGDDVTSHFPIDGDRPANRHHITVDDFVLTDVNAAAKLDAVAVAASTIAPFEA